MDIDANSRGLFYGCFQDLQFSSTFNISDGV